MNAAKNKQQTHIKTALKEQIKKMYMRKNYIIL